MKKEFTQEQLDIIREYINRTPVIEIANKRHLSREAIYQVLRRVENWDELHQGMSLGRQDVSRKLAYKAREMVLQGTAVNVALNENGISITTFHRYCPEMRAYRKNNSFKLTESIANDWMNGMAYREISQKYKMFVSNIQRRLRLYYGEDWNKAKTERGKIKAQKISQQHH